MSIWAVRRGSDNVGGRAPRRARYFCRQEPVEDSVGPAAPIDSQKAQVRPVANIKSQIKRNRQNEAARERNKSVRSALKTAVRRFDEAVASGDTDQATAAAREATRKLDKAASKGVIHKNQAANRKSSIARRAAGL